MSDMINRLFPLAPATATVTGSNATILAARPNRQLLAISNTDLTNGVFLAWGSDAAVSGRGIYLAPDGGSLFMDYAVPNVALNAIKAAGSDTDPVLSIQEMVGAVE